MNAQEVDAAVAAGCTIVGVIIKAVVVRAARVIVIFAVILVAR